MTTFGSIKRRIQSPAPATPQEPASSSSRESKRPHQDTAQQKEQIRQRLDQIKSRIEQSPEKAAIILTEWLKQASQTKKPPKKTG